MEATRIQRAGEKSLLPKNREVHLYHQEKPAKVVYTEVEEQALRADGYSEKYVPKEYPKVLANGKTARSAAEETAMLEPLLNNPDPGVPVVRIFPEGMEA